MNLPVLSKGTFDPSVLYLIFGVVLSAYFGHTSLGSCAQVVLRRGPWWPFSDVGRSRWDGHGHSHLLYMGIGSKRRSPTASTGWGIRYSAGSLTAVVGSIVYLFGSILVTLGLGMASIINVLGLFNLTREWLPTRRRVVVRLPRCRGQLLLRSSDGAMAEGKFRRPGVRLGLTYLGLTDDQPEFRLDIQADDVTRHTYIAFGDTWNATATFEQIAKLRKRGAFLSLQVHEASQESVLVHVDSSLKLTPRGEWDTVGLTPADLVSLPEDQRRLTNWLLRQGTMKHQAVTALEAATYLGQDETKIRNTLDALVSEGLVKSSEDAARTGEARFELCLTLSRGRKIPEEIWKALEKGETSTRTNAAFVGKGRLFQSLTEAVLSRFGRSYLPLIPAICAFLLTEWLVMTGTGSFTEILSFMGVILVSLLGGILPDLLIIASRRKGERLPAVTYRLLGHPLSPRGYISYFLSCFSSTVWLSGKTPCHALWLFSLASQQ